MCMYVCNYLECVIAQTSYIHEEVGETLRNVDLDDLAYSYSYTAYKMVNLNKLIHGSRQGALASPLHLC